jgi:hypothetical protein
LSQPARLLGLSVEDTSSREAVAMCANVSRLLDAGVQQVENLLVATGLLVDPGQHAVQEADQLRHLRAHRDADLGDPLPGEAIRLVHGPRGHGS